MGRLTVDPGRLARFRAEVEDQIRRGELGGSLDSTSRRTSLPDSIRTVSPAILDRLREIAEDAPNPDWEALSDRIDEMIEQERAMRRGAFLDGLDVDLAIPARFREMTLATYPDKRSRLYRAVRAWITSDELKPGLFLSGSAGVGKTALGVSALRTRVRDIAERADYLLSTYTLGWFTTEIDLLETLRRESNSNDRERDVDATSKHARSVPVLMLDDLGSMSLSDWRYAQLFRLIDARHSAGLPTIITSNDPPEAYDDRISGRISEMCEIVEAGDNAKDWRASQ